MCLLALKIHEPPAPILVLANREERFDRPTLGPRITAVGSTRFLAGVDQVAGGTWLGVNEHGVVVAVTNRSKPTVAAFPRSRGLLCKSLLSCASAEEAMTRALREVKEHEHAGGNYLCLDERAAFVVEDAGEIDALPLTPGLHLIANGALDDPADRRLELARRILLSSAIRTVDDFIDVARHVARQRNRSDPGASVIIDFGHRGTVSSTLLAIAPAPAECRYLYAPGPPDIASYQDDSRLLCRLLFGAG
jgi:uncharacterized protein with NRDE domain